MIEIELRPMEMGDLELVRTWLADPQVAQWYLTGSTLEEELSDLSLCISGEEATHALVAMRAGRPIGWCQWYRCRDYPDHAVGVGAGPEDAGIDYAIGEATERGGGVGTALIAAVVDHIRRLHPGAGVIADPEAANAASRRVLEHNGFELLAERPVSSEPTPEVMAIYRLPPQV